MSLLIVLYGVNSSITEFSSNRSPENCKVSAPLTKIMLFALSKTFYRSVSSSGFEVSVYC